MAQGHQRQRESRDERNRRAAEEREISGSINSLHRDYNAAQNKRAEESAQQLKWNRAVAITGIVSAVVTAAVFAGTVYSINQAWHAIVAANLAAEAATKQANIMEDTEVRQLRPYLHVVPGDVQWAFNADGAVEITAKPSVKVAGQTPAGQVAPAWKLKVDEYPMTDKFTFDMFTDRTSTAVVFPGDSVPIENQKITISKRDVDAVNNGTKRIYIEGTVLYIDSFAHLGKARWSHFCFFADMKGAAEGWYACPIHNGADWNPGKPSSATVPMSQ